MIKHILFDLDGTIIDSEEGILNSVRYALEKMGYPIPEKKELNKFIGPPLFVSFSEFCGMSKEDAEKAVACYREYYRPTGIYEFTVYSGVASMLKKLADSGRKLYLATSKPEIFARQILEHCDLAKYFTDITGSLLPSGRDTKVEVINHILATHTLDAADTVMVGDRHQDIEGAHEAGLLAIGITYGYGSEKELNRAGADVVAYSTKELYTIITHV